MYFKIFKQSRVVVVTQKHNAHTFCLLSLFGIYLSTSCTSSVVFMPFDTQYPCLWRKMRYELVHGNIYWNNRNHYTTRKWSLSRCLEDCCQPLTTIGKMQPCEGTNLATVAYHPHSRHQKLSFHQLLSNCSTGSSRLLTKHIHAPKLNFPQFI